MSLLDKSSGAVGMDTSIWKVAVLSAIGVVLAGMSGFYMESVLDGNSDLIMLSIWSVCFFAIFLIQTFFIKSFRISALIAGLEVSAMTTFFLDRFSWGLLTAWLVFLIMLIATMHRGRSEMENQLQVKFSKVEQRVLPSAFTAFAVFICITAVWVNGTTLTKDRFIKLISPAQPIMQTLLSRGFSFDMAISKFAELVLETKFKVNVSALPPAAKNLAINQILNQLRTQYGLTFKNSDRFGDVVFTYLMYWFEKIPESIKIGIPFGAAVLIFLTVKSFAFVLRYVSTLIAFIIYEILLTSGFARKTLESRSHEIVSL